MSPNRKDQSLGIEIRFYELSNHKAMNKKSFFLFFLVGFLFAHISLFILPIINDCHSVFAAQNAAESKINVDEQSGWVEMPAGGKPAYMGIHGGTMPVSLLVSDDGASLLSFVGRTGNDFLEVLKKAYMPFPSFGNSTREKFWPLMASGASSGLYAGNSTASMPVFALSGGILSNPAWIEHLLPFGLSTEPLSIEGSVARPDHLPQAKKYRIFLLPDSFSPKNRR